MGIESILNDFKKHLTNKATGCTSERFQGDDSEKLFRKDTQNRKRLQNHQETIDLFLEFREDAKLPPTMKQLSQPLRECFEAWQELPLLQADSERAEIVLAAYYRQDKIQDQLNKLRTFVERMDTVDSDKTARDMAYSNYVFFLHAYMKKLRDQYAAPIRPAREKTELTPDNAAWFLSTQCGHIAALCDLPKERARVKQVLQDNDTEQFGPALSNISATLELLEQENADTIRQVQELTAALAGQKANIRKKIEQGRQLFQALIAAMPEDWFQAFDPEAADSPVREMSRTELKEFYQKKLSLLEPLEERFSE